MNDNHNSRGVNAAMVIPRTELSKSINRLKGIWRLNLSAETSFVVISSQARQSDQLRAIIPRLKEKINNRIKVAIEKLRGDSQSRTGYYSEDKVVSGSTQGSFGTAGTQNGTSSKANSTKRDVEL